MGTPRVLIAGLSGGGGKTLVSVGLTAAWRAGGRSVVPFKKGPDYIDAAWLSKAAGVPCRNLDLFLMSREVVVRSFASAATGADAAVVEGNRGLFDGVDALGTFSTAELSKLLAVPVLLVVDCTKCTRTAAAFVLGCQRLDPEVDLQGVILNQTAGARHESVVRAAIEDACGIPVVGALPRMRRHPFPERHLGLVPPAEHAGIGAAIQEAASIVEHHVDLGAVWRIAAAAPTERAPTFVPYARAVAGPQTVTIGVFRDAAFQFYYPENLEALERAGARLVEITPLEDPHLPEVDALYIGGGFPETLAATLAANGSFRESVRRAVEDDLPVYAECGGAVYLGEKLVMGHHQYPMSAAVPAVFGFGDRPQGHGYAEIETVKANPFYQVGEVLRGHEFHYTLLRSVIAENVTFAFRVRRGHGYDGHRDGLTYRNVLASYTHVHALGSTGWAESVVSAARSRRWRALAHATAHATVAAGDAGGSDA
jgi:cobyrinic acid a,c-diamide synthase